MTGCGSAPCKCRLSPDLAKENIPITFMTDARTRRSMWEVKDSIGRLETMITDAVRYSREQLQDPPEIRDWVWTRETGRAS